VRGVPETILVAPDSFKGTLRAVEIADAVSRGLEREGVPVDRCPLADGGEGTLEALIPAFDCELVQVRVSDPLGRPVTAAFGLGREGRRVVAVVEMAAASGLGLVAPEERDALKASTYGTGELIAAALGHGASTVYVGVGGSATTDGGEGAIRALEETGGGVDAAGLGGAELVVLCDVRSRFVQAATVFAPQKGADAAAVRRLARRLEKLAEALPRDPREVPMTGAAGGLAGGLWARFGAELMSGAAFVLDALDFDRRMRAARAVVTGEGTLDQQSLAGKLISEVATRARQSGVPCHAVVGRRELDSFGARVLDLQVILEAGTVAALEEAGRELAARLAVPAG
jgi:glycerate 2-kinase